MSKKDTLKRIVKKVAPAATFGTNPTDPWSAKSNLAESAMLDKYLMSIGRQPQNMTKDQKVAFSKTDAFKQWALHHQESLDIENDKQISENSVFKDYKVKVNYTTHGGEKGDHEHHVKSALSVSHAQNIAMNRHAKQFAGKHKHYSTSPANITEIPRKESFQESALLDKYLKSRGIEPKFASKDTKVAHSKSNQFKQWLSYHQEEVQAEDVGHMATKGESGKTHERKSSLMKTAHTYKIIKTPHGPGSHNESKGSQMTQLTPEDVGDPKAATHADGLTAQVDQMKSEKKNQLSKSARIIKSLYKKHRMNEDMYDHEKEDKSVATYGKKPKHEKADKDDSKGENKPKAAAVLSGGKTLTGQDRDTIEIDPMMRNRPGQPDVTKKDDKKDDKKKDK